MTKPVLNWDKTRRITMKYGYARVSTHDQNLARQIKILTDLQVDRIYQEKASGANLDRPILNQIISKIKEGDELVVTSLDRLSRDADDTTKLIVKLSLRGARLRALMFPVLKRLKTKTLNGYSVPCWLKLKSFWRRRNAIKFWNGNGKALIWLCNEGFTRGDRFYLART